MNLIDLVISIPLGYIIYKGFKRGLIFELISLFGIVLGSMAAVRFSHWFADLVGIGEEALLVAFFIIFIGVVILSLFAAKLLERFVKLVHVGALNNIAGALFGLLKGVCILGVLLYLFAVVDIKEKVLTHNAKQQSLLYHPVERSGKRLVGQIEYYVRDRKIQHEKQEQSLNK